MFRILEIIPRSAFRFLIMQVVSAYNDRLQSSTTGLYEIQALRWNANSKKILIV